LRARGSRAEGASVGRKVVRRAEGASVGRKVRPSVRSAGYCVLKRLLRPPLSAPTKSVRPQRRTAVPVRRGHALRLERHRDAPDPTDPRTVRRWVKGVRGPTAVDLFSGAGGLSLGLQTAGFTVVAAVDSDPLAVETHAATIRGVGCVADLTDPSDFIDRLDQWGISSVDLVAGGPPCQPFSRAGQSKLRDLVRSGSRPRDDPRARLWQSFMAVVEHLTPRAVLIENVPDLAAWDDGAVLLGFCESLAMLGYTVDARILDSFAFGVPQHRRRLFVVGTSEGALFEWPCPASQMTTVRDAIGDLPAVHGGQLTEEMAYRARTRRSLSAFQVRMRDGVNDDQRGVIYDHITRAVRADDLEAFELLQEGETYDDLPTRLQRYRTDIFTDKYKRLAWDGLSRTITAHIAKDGYWYIHPDQHRTLSIREAARLQTFPDRVRFAGQPSRRFLQIGNAVPPLLAEAVGRSFIATLAATRRRSTKRRPARVQTRDVLIAWHRENARSYPWRGVGLDPWHVLMAEMCLHRTRADQVQPVFEALVELAPNPAMMVERADEALDALTSLGLRWRAENVVAAAEVLLELFDGVVPDDSLALRILPGVGDYVANAVRCFGFGRRAVLLDTNTMRIVSRVKGRDIRHRWQLRLDLHQLAGPQGPDAEFNYALLDLGALACRAREPRCSVCPIREYCVTAPRDLAEPRAATPTE
jgi:DNA (cytosine-5)-methyltransferase 1